MTAQFYRSLLSRSALRRGLQFLAATGLFAATVSPVAAAPSDAQISLQARPERIPEPGRNAASVDDSTAITLNPANLAFLPSYELRWSSMYLEEEARVPYQGHAFSFATPLPLVDASIGVRVDSVSPPSSAPARLLADYQWLTLALAVPLGHAGALGASVATSFSRSSLADDLTSLSVGYTGRVCNCLSLAFLLHNANSPRNRFVELGRSWNVAAAIRPLGTRALELGLESAYLENEDIWTPSAQLGVNLGPVGRLRGSFAMNAPTQRDRNWLASLGISLYLNGMSGSSELTGGALSGNALGLRNSYNPYLSVATRGFRERVGFEPGRYAVRLRIEDTPSNRQHVSFLRRLWSLAEEPNLDAVAFELRDAPADSMAHAEELRDAIFNLRRAGKRVVCHLEDASGSALLMCSAANRILINPAGGIRFAGLHSEQLYLARVMEKLGVGADFVRIGAHKSAPEQFTNSKASDVARADRVDFMQQLERHFTEGVSIGRNLGYDQIRASVTRGPFTAAQAKTEGFVDRLVFDDELEREVRDLTGRSEPLLKDNRAPRVAQTFGQGGAIAVVYVDGDIIDGRNRTIPLLGTDLVGSYTIADTLKSLRDDSRVKAIVLRVESPGGSSLGSDVMWRQVKLAAGVKPVVVSMGSIAASGGYYVAAPATRVFANPSTVTGSIGVFYGKADISDLLTRIGVDVETYKTHEHADADGLYRRFTEQERISHQAQVEQFYDLFVSRVAEGRKLSKDQVNELGQGRVWTGEQAVKNGLADELGGLRQALAYARAKADLPDNAPIIELPRVEESLLSRLIGIPGLAQNLYDLPMPKGLTKTLQSLAPFLIFDGDVPLARMEIVPPRLD